MHTVRAVGAVVEAMFCNSMVSAGSATIECYAMEM